MSAKSYTVSVSSDSYPNRLNPQVVIPFEPDSIQISTQGADEIKVSFSDGIQDDGALVPATELRTQTWAVRHQKIWLRRAVAGGAQDVLVEVSEGPKS